jgi:signal transduction histidine kinase
MADGACVLAALVIGGLASDATDVSTVAFAETNDLIGCIAALTLFWRRRFPVAIGIASSIAGFFAPLAAGTAVMAIFSVAVFRPTRTAVAMAAFHIAPTLLFVSPYPDRDLSRWQSAVAGVLVSFAALGWGLVVRSRQQLLESLAERAERAEADQQARVEQARRAERHRIAGEMHDVLAHRLSLLSLHAGAVELRPDAPPDELARAAAVIRSSAHLALEELRAVVGVLRTDFDAAGTEPQPTLGTLPGLIDECRSAGMEVELDDRIDEAAVPPDVARHAYRVVQEGLTNARKHAPDAAVTVSLTGDAGEGVTVRIDNPCSPHDLPADIPGGGAGLIGLGERVALAGGRIEHGIDPDGVHRLRAWLPWPA